MTQPPAEGSRAPAARARVGALAPLAICAVPLAAAAILAFHDGGYFVTSWGVAAIVMWSLVAAAALAWSVGRIGVLGIVAAGGWIALGAWQGISGAWADEPAAATAAMNLTLLYGAAFILVLLAARGGPRCGVSSSSR